MSISVNVNVSVILDSLLKQVRATEEPGRPHENLRLEVVKLYRFYGGMQRHKLYSDDWLAHNEAWALTYNRNLQHGPLLPQELRSLVKELQDIDWHALIA